MELHKNTYSIKVLKQKLFQKGIKKNIIDSLFESEEIDFDEESIIKKLLLKKCPDYYEREKDMEPKERQKILAYLYRKGFSYDKIADVMKCNS